MRVLHVIESLGVGGAERVLVQLLPRLREQGIEGEVAALREPYTLAGEMEAQGIAVHRLDFASLWNLWKGGRTIAGLAQERGCDLVHANLLFPTLYTALARRLFAPELHTATSFHNLAYARGANRRGPSYGLRKSLNRRACRTGMDRCLAVSGAVAAHYRAELGVENIVTVHNPVDIAALDAAGAGEQARWPGSGAPDAVRIVLPGRLVHEKGHCDLLDALVALGAQGTDFDAVLAGDGPLRPAIESRIAELALAGRVHITGRLEHAALAGIMRQADIVVVPSRYEGFGLTAAEAMALRRAVVATDVGGLTDIVLPDETGVRVPERDPEALAAAIAALAADPQRRARLGDAGRSHVEHHFAADMVAARIAGIYREILSDRAV